MKFRVPGECGFDIHPFFGQSFLSVSTAWAELEKMVIKPCLRHLFVFDIGREISLVDLSGTQTIGWVHKDDFLRKFVNETPETEVGFIIIIILLIIAIIIIAIIMTMLIIIILIIRIIIITNNNNI